MEDIVAIRVRGDDQDDHYFLTWGRAFHPVDSAPLLEAIGSHLHQFGIVPQSIQICESLQEAAKSKYFYEGFWKLSQEQIPFGSQYKKWLRKKTKLISKGKDLYYAGKDRKNG